MYPSILRSTRVRKAIATKIGTISINKLIKNINVKKRS